MTSEREPTIMLLPVAAGDFDELSELRIAAMRESLERVGRFDPTRARERLRSTFSPEHTQFIVLENEKIGFYTARPALEGLWLDHLYLLPEFQNRGFGTVVLKKLFKEADHNGVPVLVGALKESASNRFYQRHGFLKTKEAQWDVYYIRPPSRAPGRRSLDH